MKLTLILRFLPLLGLVTWSPSLVTSNPVSFSQDGVIVNGNTIDLQNTHRTEGILRFSILGGANVSKVTASKDTRGNTETWTMDLEDKTQIKLHRERPRISTQLSEYTLEWPGAGPNLKREICFHYGFNKAHWFSTYQENFQRWPLDTSADTPQTSFTTRHLSGTNVSAPGSLVEYVFLNSDGFIVSLEQTSPWFIRRNFNSGDPILCFSISNISPYSNQSYNSLRLHILDGPNLKVAYENMLIHYPLWANKPLLVPDQVLLKHPIWDCSWTNGTQSNQKNILEYAANLRKYNLKVAHLEISDAWEAKIGDLTFDLKAFPNASKMIQELKTMGFDTSLGVYPFVNKDAHAYQEGLPYYVKSRTDSTKPSNVTWWNGSQAGVVDFTFYGASSWFLKRLEHLRSQLGVTSFVFNAGEVNWYTNGTFYTLYARRVPNYITQAYVQFATHFGPSISVGSGFKSQSDAVFVRMFNQNQGSSFEDRLRSLIARALTMALAGYDYILPNMDVPGTELPSEELYLRWIQATTFFPSMHISIPPWSFTEKTLNLTRSFINLHSEHAPTRIALSKELHYGESLLSPMWMAEPEEAKAYLIDDQFMVGRDLVVAPILKRGVVERTVYLPKGSWIDQTGKTYAGPGEFKVLAPIETLPYFKRQHAPKANR